MYEFMSESPFTTIILAYIFGHILIVCINRPLRHMNIRKHGWPPEHCDADGDFKPEEEYESEGK